MRARALLVAVALLLGACSPATAGNGEPPAETVVLPAESPATELLAAAAGDLCAAYAWPGIPEPGSFPDEAAALDVPEATLIAAVRRTCPDSFYAPLSRAEVDWCGGGLSFGKNFFLVVEAGVRLGIESFTVVEPALVAKAASRSSELTDYEIELLTAELQTMTESSRFERDWAEACRSTF